MYRKAVNYLRGQAVAEVVCTAPERVVNLCAAHGIPFWDLTWLTETSFRVTTTLSGARRLAEVTADIGAQVTVCRKSGAPELWRRCWDFEVTGNDTVPTESVLQALERCGVRVGTRGVGLDQDELRNRVLPLLPDVVYLAVNVRGCTAHVQVVERVRPPHLYRDSDVQNIVAARDGLITKIEALDGVTCAAVGETVQAGQVLLSGVADSPRGCRYMRATGRIWARTWYEWTVSVPLETVLKDGTEPVKTRTHTALDLGRHRIALPAGDSILQGRENCDKIIRYRGVQLPFGLRLPVTLVTETVAERAVYDGQRPEDEACAEGQKQLEAQLAQTIGDDGRVLKADVSARRQGAYLMVTLRAECEEQIGVDAPLTITSDTGR